MLLLSIIGFLVLRGAINTTIGGFENGNLKWSVQIKR